jgi:hypothetical protein
MCRTRQQSPEPQRVEKKTAAMVGAGSRIAKEDGDQNKAATVLGSSDAEDANTSRSPSKAEAEAETANRQL